MLTPEHLHALHNLPLAAKRAAEGLLHGAHASRRRGRGWSSASTGPTSPATTCAGWTGAWPPAPTGTTCASRR
ncbi:hypothetical protein MUN84_13045 [Hymenobacter sp. 5516J-16]|uniref:hypothetical protein n=1 Tax=Hymenobacter sp. 5516J-16 TaxID=2932253 RepID=UPI001FD3A87C|nr:hypothetical protein [Hymenobacter sp. 5516J-16]UOQ75611.1 hypothetical protein MUN84_13045 [Hymenobacter sp. 5516J-16]